MSVCLSRVYEHFGAHFPTLCNRLQSYLMCIDSIATRREENLSNVMALQVNTLHTYNQHTATAMLFVVLMSINPMWIFYIRLYLYCLMFRMVSHNILVYVLHLSYQICMVSMAHVECNIFRDQRNFYFLFIYLVNLKQIYI